MGNNETASELETRIAALQAKLAGVVKVDASVGVLAKLTALIRASKRIMAALVEVNENVTLTIDGGVTLTDAATSGTKETTMPFGRAIAIYEDGHDIGTRSISKAMASARGLSMDGAVGKRVAGVASPVLVAGATAYRNLFDAKKYTMLAADGVVRPLTECILASGVVPPDITEWDAPTLTPTPTPTPTPKAKATTTPRRVKAANAPLPIAK